MEQAMSNQEVFDKVVNHLRKQGRKSYLLSPSYSIEMCGYRGDGGCKCAAGVLITDEEYSLDMEGKRFHTLIESFASLKRYASNQQLIFSLQRVHDHYEVSNWETELRRVAKDFGLVYVSV